VAADACGGLAQRAQSSAEAAEMGVAVLCVSAPGLIGACGGLAQRAQSSAEAAEMGVAVLCGLCAALRLCALMKRRLRRAGAEGAEIGREWRFCASIRCGRVIPVNACRMRLFTHF
jgi:hypothetical protein